MSEIISLLNQGVALFEKLSGISRDKSTGNFTAGDYNDRCNIESLDEALKLDSTGVTAVLLLRYYTESKVASRTFNWLELLRNPGLASQLDLPREIISLIESPLITSASQQFQGQLTKALTIYGAMDRPDVQKLLDAPNNLALLRRDALRSMERLRIDQFLDGDNDPEGTVPVYAKKVHQWWNINTMIEHLVMMPSGVSLNLIREPDGYSSYFAFAIRNGGRLFILSDIEPEAHPLQRQMSRRPDRTLERRISRNWFPYDLLNLSLTEDGELYIDACSKSTALAVRQTQALPLKEIIDLDPEELVWVTMMFDLILERFWRNDYRAPELSYTGEMIKSEVALLNVAQAAGLPVPMYEKIGLTPITTDRIKTNDQDIKDALGSCPDISNQWMVDRYGDQCKDESLNLLSMPADIFLIGEDHDIQTTTGAELARKGHYEKEDLVNSGHRLHQLRATSFGTKDRLDKDRIWLARYNFATQVQAAANREFYARKDEVFKWYESRVRANLPNLLKYVGYETLYRAVEVDGVFGTHVDVPCGRVVHKTNSSSDDKCVMYATFMMTKSREQRDQESRDGIFMQPGWHGALDASDKAQNGDPLCAFTGAKVSFVKTFWPVTAQDIALLAGCAISDLPDVLQNFYGVTPYTGNSILDRIDPAVSKLKNPWHKLRLSVRIGLSKRGVKQAQAIKDEGITELYELDLKVRVNQHNLQKGH